MWISARHTGAGLALAVVATGLGVFGPTGPASAHVTVEPEEAAQGERARISIRVPTESDTESTTALEVHFPEEAPISSVSVGTTPGWSAEVSYRGLDEPVDDGHGGQVTEAVEAIVWTADSADAAIAPGEFAEFPVSLGPLPMVDQLSFPALQTYSDGETVHWIEPPGESADPQFPAPTLTLAAADAVPAGEADGSEDRSGAGEQPAGAAEPGAGSDRTGGWLGLAGLVAALTALALAGFALVRTRATTNPVPEAGNAKRVGTAR